MNKQFEVVIRWLTDLVNQPEPKNMSCTLHYVYHGDNKDEFRSAIRVLEAAGRVSDKTLALCVFNDLFDENRVPDDLRIGVGHQLRAILSALPAELHETPSVKHNGGSVADEPHKQVATAPHSGEASNATDSPCKCKCEDLHGNSKE